MCGKEETQAWRDKESQLNILLDECGFWHELINSGSDKQLMRLLESLVYAVGDDEVLETYVKQDATIYDSPKTLLGKRIQVVIFTQARVCVGVLDNPTNGNNVCVHVFRRSDIRRLSISVSRGAFSQDDSSVNQCLCITVEYDGLTDPLIIGSLEPNRIGYGPGNYLKRINHLIDLMIDDLNSSVSKQPDTLD